jgi:hypothetical protein
VEAGIPSVDEHIRQSTRDSLLSRGHVEDMVGEPDITSWHGRCETGVSGGPIVAGLATVDWGWGQIFAYSALEIDSRKNHWTGALSPGQKLGCLTRNYVSGVAQQ